MSEQVTIKLNGKDVTVPKGWTVMQAARQEKVRIPHFCWHPGLSIAGVCRFCMVKVEGRPKLEVACNLPAVEGMVVDTVSEPVKEAHKSALEFHLANHPLDCPICDQAGECKLQDYYMEVGKYKSQMTSQKVLKPKALDVGSELILDTERCILCSRCVRFEDEVTKTGALGIFDRGDRSIIGTFKEEKITHNYQENLVDICPVGAFTSKSFRFKQRVWFLKEKDSICPGCSTGCKISVHARPDQRQYYRIKPVRDPKANEFWMCDKGRKTFQHLNPAERLDRAFALDQKREQHEVLSADAIKSLGEKIKSHAPADIAILVSAQYTSEEYQTLFEFFVSKLGVKNIFQWREPTEKRDEFDGILLRGDRNANTQGLQEQFKTSGISKEIKNEFDDCLASQPKLLIALSPEIPDSFPSLELHLKQLSELCTQGTFVSLWSCHFLASELGRLSQLLPMKGFAEKKGSFLNYAKEVRPLSDPYPSVISEAMDVTQLVGGLKQWV